MYLPAPHTYRQARAAVRGNQDGGWERFYEQTNGSPSFLAQGLRHSSQAMRPSMIVPLTAHACQSVTE